MVSIVRGEHRGPDNTYQNDYAGQNCNNISRTNIRHVDRFLGGGLLGQSVLYDKYLS